MDVDGDVDTPSKTFKNSKNKFVLREERANDSLL